MNLSFSLVEGALAPCLFLYSSCALVISFSLEMERELRAFVITLWIVPITLSFWLVVRSLPICSVSCVLSVH